MTVSQRARAAVMGIMQDNVPRTAQEVCAILHGKYSSTYGNTMGQLMREGALKLAGTVNVGICSKAKVFQLAPPAEEITGPTDNPFFWRSYKHHEAEVPQLRY